MLQNFVEDLDINHPDNTRRALDGLVPDPDAFIRAAQSDEVKARLREQTKEARARGIFGAPTFFVGDEMFWGDDRLEDALELARSTTHDKD
jgi:2-hydroxychromene-2-carboxylate isomerase